MNMIIAENMLQIATELSNINKRIDELRKQQDIIIESGREPDVSLSETIDALYSEISSIKRQSAIMSSLGLSEWTYEAQRQYDMGLYLRRDQLDKQLRDIQATELSLRLKLLIVDNLTSNKFRKWDNNAQKRFDDIMNIIQD